MIIDGVEYHNYKVIEETDEKIVIEVMKETRKYKDCDTAKLVDAFFIEEEYFNKCEDEYSDYGKRVDEFAYCGYNEEDPDFHGMVLHLNSLGDKMDKSEKAKNEMLNELYKRTESMDRDEFESFIDEYGLYDYF